MHETTRCQNCKGTGKVPLLPHLQKTLDWLREHGPATASQAREGMKFAGEVTAMCNRLKALLELKWVRRDKVGREWVYEALPF